MVYNYFALFYITYFLFSFIYIEDIFVSGTFAGETLSMAAALATIKKLEILNVPQKLEELGSKLIKQTNDIILRLNLQKYIEMEGNNWWPRFTFKNQSNITLHLFSKRLLKADCS